MALANAAMVAAQALQASAEAMCAASIRSSGGFAEANKVLKYPEPFGSENHDGDVLAWHDWCHGFKAWIIFAQPEYDTELELIEESVEQEVSLAETAAKTRMRSLKLYAILSSFLRFIPKNLLKQVVDNNGLEVWRQLLHIFSPRTKARSPRCLTKPMKSKQ